MLFTGGGTGGHVYPGVAVLRRLLEHADVRVGWIGDPNGMEAGIVRGEGIAFHAIPTGKLRRYLSFRNVVDLFRIAAGIVRLWRLIGRLRPAVLFSKGGFVSVPPVIAARLRGVPVISHESDSDPGLATRINARFSERILVPYERTRAYFPDPERVVVTGNPLRPEILSGDRDAGVRFLGMDSRDDRPLALFVGGSLGARQINELVDALRPEIHTSWRVAHQSGEHGGEPVHGPDYVRLPYIRAELPDVLAAADLLVCRAGASTLWEAAALGKPMLLVPLGAGSRGDQLRNAQIFQDAGGALTFVDPVSLADDVRDARDRMGHDPELRARMGARARGVVCTDASDRIATLIASYIDRAKSDGARVGPSARKG